MNLLKVVSHYGKSTFVWLVASLFVGVCAASAATEETFGTLQIGSQMYQNVTVTTKAKTYIVLMHAMGMNTVKVKELSPELRVKLGYPLVLEPDAPKHQENPLTTWTKNTISKAGMEKKWRAYAPTGLATIELTTNLIFALYICGALFYFLMCYCGMLICEKSGH